MTVLPSSDRARRAVLPVAFCLGLAVVLTACGEDPDEGTNGVGKLTAAEIDKKARAAAGTAGAVRLSGTLVSGGEAYKLNMRLKENGALGSVVSKNSTFQLLRIEDALYLKADAGFWSHADDKATTAPGTSDSEAAGKLGDKYVKVPEEDPAYKQLTGFTDMNVLLGGILSLHGELNKGDRDRIGGVRTIKISGSEGDGGTLDVSLEGTPYPVRLQRAGNGGTLTLADWGKDFELAAPSKGQTVDYGSRLPKTGE
ncbi:hypothetical protein [Streptomyces corynorhini]|uniref:hypothetical protein n=1 Tax=Streptomyces corynorhini TaxID=2282652 RepID=UPI001F1F2697|nr:hypothetical protein [Streptomyces corynorhini]